MSDEEDAQEAVTDYLRNTYNLAGGAEQRLGILARHLPQDAGEQLCRHLREL
jgi:hypothetical protein